MKYWSIRQCVFPHRIPLCALRVSIHTAITCEHGNFWRWGKLQDQVHPSTMMLIVHVYLSLFDSYSVWLNLYIKWNWDFLKRFLNSASFFAVNKQCPSLWCLPVGLESMQLSGSISLQLRLVLAMLEHSQGHHWSFLSNLLSWCKTVYLHLLIMPSDVLVFFSNYYQSSYLWLEKHSFSLIH